MKAERVVLLGMPKMLCQIVREILEETPDFEIIAELPGTHLDSAELISAEPSTVIVGAERVSATGVAGLLHRDCRTRVLSISADGWQSTLYEMRPHRVALGELGPATLLDALRSGRGSGRQ